MSQQYLAEIRMMSFNFPPKGWALCNGQTMSIQQNTALFSLLGTTYGGNGTTNFNLPNLQGRVPLGYGSGVGGSYELGELGGEINHTLLLSEMPQHNHLMQGKATNGITGGAQPTTASVLAQGALFAGTVASGAASLYSGLPAGLPMAPNAIALDGGNQPHVNQQPYQVINFCIALVGIFPSRN